MVEVALTVQLWPGALVLVVATPGTGLAGEQALRLGGRDGVPQIADGEAELSPKL